MIESSDECSWMDGQRTEETNPIRRPLIIGATKEIWGNEDHLSIAPICELFWGLKINHHPREPEEADGKQRARKESCFQSELRWHRSRSKSSSLPGVPGVEKKHILIKHI